MTGWLIQKGLRYVLIWKRPVCEWRETREVGAEQSLLSGLQNPRPSGSGERSDPGSQAEVVRTWGK